MPFHASTNKFYFEARFKIAKYISDLGVKGQDIIFYFFILPMEKTSLFDRLNNWVKQSYTLKLLIVGFLILILLIPASMLESLIRERRHLRDSAMDEISSKWGGIQTIAGPVLTVPYNALIKNEQGDTEYQIRYAHFLPKDLQITGNLNPEKRYRGIYVVVLYKTFLHVSGTLEYPDLQSLGIRPEDCLFNQAFISLGISDLKGINDQITCQLNEANYVFGPGVPTHEILQSGISFRYPLSKDVKMKFSFDINLNGSSSINFLPFGEETHVHLTSAWATPSFDGAFLPDTRSVSDSGFSANWKVLQLNRNYAQQGLGAFINNDRSYETSDFGVRLILPVDEYQKTIRSVKYCIMLLIITFLTFFFVEVLNRKRIHPIQYLLVGFAICLFYVLLLSISEHLTFAKAYLISAVAIVTLITFYVKHVFEKRSLTIIFSVILTILYAFFYSLLQLEDYSLLLGSIGLFLILTAIMYLTRKVNWYRSGT